MLPPDVDPILGCPVYLSESVESGTVLVVTSCPNCEGKGHEGRGHLEDDYPCRHCMGAGVVGVKATGVASGDNEVPS